MEPETRPLVLLCDRQGRGSDEEPRFLRLLEERFTLSNKGFEPRDSLAVDRVGFAEADAVETQDATVAELRIG